MSDAIFRDSEEIALKILTDHYRLRKAAELERTAASIGQQTARSGLDVMVHLSGPQGCGKTRTAQAIRDLCIRLGLTEVDVLDGDTNDGSVTVLARHPLTPKPPKPRRKP